MEKFEKIEEFAGIVSESEIDEMLNETEAGSGAGVSVVVTAIYSAISWFAGCPTKACTDDCRL